MANHLIIGLGGTGGSVIRALRKRIFEEFRSNDPIGEANIEYLYVDSSLADLNNETTWRTLGHSVQLSPAQRLSINGVNAGLLDNLDQYPGISAFINRKDMQMMREGIGPIINEGIGGQRRRFGRMLIANNMCGLPQDSFMGQVHARVRELKTREDVDNVTFHICAGLGGGTGSGTIIDAVSQIRNDFRRNGNDNDKFKIQLYLYVPEKIIHIEGGEASNKFYQPNGYAALLELNAMSVGKYRPTDVKGSKDEDGNVNRLLEGQEPFDVAYLYSNVNEAGKEVNLHTVLPGIVADFLFQKIIVSSIGSNGRMERLMCNENLTLTPEENEKKEPVHSRRFMTMGVKRIEYPETEVVEYCAYKFANQAITQMIYGLWDDARGYIECNEDMVGKSYSTELSQNLFLEENLLSDDYLTLGKPLPSIEKNVTNWRPIVSGWELYIDRYKQDVQSDCNKSEWYEEFNNLCDEFFESMYRGKGVKKFYLEMEDQIPGFAEEISRRIENNLFAKWKTGDISVIEISKFFNVLIKLSNERIEKYNSEIGRLSKLVNEDIAERIDYVRDEWNNIGFLRDAVTNVSVRVFGKFADLKREQMIAMNKVFAYRYASKLLAEIVNNISMLKTNFIDEFFFKMKDLATMMKKQAETKCSFTDGSKNMTCEVVKMYDPEFVRSTVDNFMKDKDGQLECSTKLRNEIIALTRKSCTTFRELVNETRVAALTDVCVNACMESARNEMKNYSDKNKTKKLVDVNILDKLMESECSTPEKRKKFIQNIYNEAQSFLTFNVSEEGKGSIESAANHTKIIQLSLPVSENEEFRNEFINDFASSGRLRFDKVNDVSENFKSNQIVIITSHAGFPLRYVDNVKILKEKYDVLTRDEVCKMVVHTESFAKPLPSLFNGSGADRRKELCPYVFLAYCLDIIKEQEDHETGEKYFAFAGEKNRMGRVSRWIPVGYDIIETLDDLSKMTRIDDSEALIKMVKAEMDANYKHVSKRNDLMLKMGSVLDNVLLPLVNGNENNPNFVAFNKVAEEMCDNDFKNILA